MRDVDRRAYPRFETDLTCLVDGTTEGRIRNLSIGGALLVGPVGLATVDDVVSVEIREGPSGPLELFSDVVRVGVNGGTGAAYGLRFLLLEARREELRQWLKGLGVRKVPEVAGQTEHRRVMGSVFVDYVRMMRSAKGMDWAKYLRLEDYRYLTERIEPDQWYPMETFERMGLAILAELAQGDVMMAKQWGRAQVEGLVALHSNLVAALDPRETLMRFEVLRNSFFDYSAVDLVQVSDGEATVAVDYRMGPIAEEAASLQAMGFFERLLEIAGGSQVQAWFSAESWRGAKTTVLELRWVQE